MRASLRNWFKGLPELSTLWRQRLGGRPAAPPPRQEPLAAQPVVNQPPPPPRTRLDPPDADELANVADQLWGDGFLLPGGATEAIRLANLLPLSPATTLLLIGADAGGAAAAIATARGAWVAAQQDNLVMAERMALRLRPLGKRATVATWDSEEPFFRHRYHHHALSLEALRRSKAAWLLPAIAAGLKPGGQFVLLELVAGLPATGRTQALVDRWVDLEGRSGPPESPGTLEAALSAAGFTVNVREDVGARHGSAVMSSWMHRVEQLRQAGMPPSKPAAVALITEAERWLLRQRLMELGHLRLMRWHATRGPDRAGGL